MTVRDEILSALPAIRGRIGSDVFTIKDVIDEMSRRGTSYADSTIRTHVASRMCANAPDNHARVYADLERVAPGRYRCRSASD
jgi:hypothetical protein